MNAEGRPVDTEAHFGLLQCSLSGRCPPKTMHTHFLLLVIPIFSMSHSFFICLDEGPLSSPNASPYLRKLGAYLLCRTREAYWMMVSFFA